MIGQDEPAGTRRMIRVALADLPEVLQRTMEAAVTKQPDMRLVALPGSGPADRMNLLLAVERGIDVLVLGSSDLTTPPGIGSHLLAEFPDLILLILSHRGDAAVVYWRGVRRRLLRRPSMGALLGGIRRARSPEALTRPGRSC
jgi:hypothetical protein